MIDNVFMKAGESYLVGGRVCLPGAGSRGGLGQQQRKEQREILDQHSLGGRDCHYGHKQIFIRLINLCWLEMGLILGNFFFFCLFCLLPFLTVAVVPCALHL